MGSENMFLELPCETKYFEAENSGCMYNYNKKKYTNYFKIKS